MDNLNPHWGGNICVLIADSHCVQQKQTQNCKAVILQLKIKYILDIFKKWNKSSSTLQGTGLFWGVLGRGTLLFLMVWFSPEQNEIMHLRSQQKSFYDDSHSILRELEVRPAWGGRDMGVSVVCLMACQLIVSRSKMPVLWLLAWVMSWHVLTPCLRQPLLQMLLQNFVPKKDKGFLFPF